MHGFWQAYQLIKSQSHWIAVGGCTSIWSKVFYLTLLTLNTGAESVVILRQDLVCESLQCAMLFSCIILCTV